MTLKQFLDGSASLLGESDLTNEEYRDLILLLNDMVDSWSIDTSKIYASTIETLNLVSGTAEYTIGTGGDFSTDRPDRIVSAFLRDATGSDNIDYPPLDEIAKINYDGIRIKDIQSRPAQYMFLREFPLAKIIFDKEPDIAYELHLTSMKPLSSFSVANLNSTISLPPGYARAYKYNLAIESAPYFQTDTSREVVAVAGESRNNIEQLNATPVPEIAAERGLPDGTQGQSAYTDDWRNS